jgi:hypothetical protein
VIIEDTVTLVTPEHPYWIPEHGWVHAQNLKPGDLLHGPSGDRVPVERVTREQHDIPVTVYNMEIGDYHTYYAGQAPALVHNAGQNYKPMTPVKGVIKTVKNPDGSTSYTKIIDGKEVSVKYSKDGYPDFTPFVHPKYSKSYPVQYSGNRSTDNALANRAAGIPGRKPPKGYVWHHLEDGKSMILVNRSVHDVSYGGFPHTGGFSISKGK